MENPVISGLRLWATYLGPRRGRVTLLTLLVVGSTAAQIVTPLFLRRFVDDTTARAQLGLLMVMALLYLTFTAGSKLLWLAAEYAGGVLAWDATNELRADLLDHCLHQDLLFYQQHSPGSLIERIDGDVAELADYFAQVLLLVVVNILLLIGVAGVLFAINWRVGLLFVSFIAMALLILRRLVGQAVTRLAEQRAVESDQLGYLEEHLAGMLDVQGVRAEPYVMSGLSAYATRLTDVAVLASRVAVRWPGTTERLASLGNLLGIASGVWLYLAGQISLGTVFAIAAYLAMVRIPLLVITTQFQELEEVLAASSRIAGLFGARSEIADGAATLAAGAVTLELAGVGFSYAQAEAPALDGVSVVVPPGRTLGIVGESGSGKSTLMRLLFRFADPTSGSITWNGTDLRDFTVDSLRSRIALVTQEVQIFHGTVRDNLTFFDPATGDDAIRQALAEVGLGDWLDGLPAGLDTMLGTGAVRPSAGQEQLLAFARALLADPALVLLDEVSSRLDAVSQSLLLAAMERLTRGRTTVIVAHRLEALATASHILVLDAGRAVGYGRHSQVRHLLHNSEVLA